MRDLPLFDALNGDLLAEVLQVDVVFFVSLGVALANDSKDDGLRRAGERDLGREQGGTSNWRVSRSGQKKEKRRL